MTQTLHTRNHSKRPLFLGLTLLLGLLVFGTVYMFSSANATLAQGTNDAEFVTQSVPTYMFPGSSHNVSVTMKNTGTNVWQGAGWGVATNHRLSVLPQNDTTWGRTGDGLDDDDRITQNDEKVFDFIVTAPSTPGTYDFQWQMEDGGTLFGDTTTKVSIDVDWTP